MRLLLVFPGALYSTIDVARGFHKAFKKMQDVEIFTFQFDKYLVYHDYAQKFIQGKAYNQELVLYEAAMDVLQRIDEVNPDWVIFISGIAFPTVVWERLVRFQSKLRQPFKTAVIFTEAPYCESWEMGILERVNAAFVTDYGVIPDYRAINPNTYYMRHCYDTEIHFRSGQPKSDVFFVATGFPERQKLLENVDWSGINLELYGNWLYMTPNSPLMPYLKGENMDNCKVAEKYREAKISLNIFRTVQWPDANPKFIEPDKAKSLSPRCYEILACGSLLLTDWREELNTLPKDSYVLWGDAKELEEKIHFYLSNESERERIAEHGYNAVQGNTFDARAIEIMNVLKEF